ncbi:MAG: photoactive yellow protein [Acidimicrobiia bacterium]|nr:photoactive yellow protein [Acidimicrobiia bacterium]
MIEVADPVTDMVWDQASRAATAGGALVGPQLLARLDDATAADLAALDLSAIRLDDDGVVQSINAAALQLAGLAPLDAIDYNFFTELAPCTNNRIFRGVFAKGVNRGGMNLVFSYVLTYRWSPTEVTVHLHRTPAGHNWVFLRRR